MATGMFSGVPSPNRSVLGAQQLQRPAEPYLRQQYPEVYGALGGFMGMAPDEMSGSIFDPNTARVRAGAEYGFPVGTAAQVAPLTPMLATGAKATAKALGPTAVSMGEGYLKRRGLMPGVVEGESIGMLGGPIKPQAPVSELGFYSAAEQAALNLPRKSGTGESFLNDLMKGQDVKKDELSWLGLDDYLRGKPNVTRQEVQDFIASNRVDVKEVRLGEPLNINKFSDVQLDAEHQRMFGTSLENDYGPDWRTRRQDIIDELANPELESNISGATKYQQYQLPGGENYREILLTLPKEQPKVVPLEGSGGRWGVQMPDGTITSRYYDKFDAEQALRFDAQKAGVTYTSSHFDEPNILAHMRVNDRVDADGKKMLLIEEVQSDWHQAGRERGYKTGKERNPAQVEKELTITTQKRSRLLEEAAALPDSEMTKFKAMNEEIKKLSEQATKLNEEWTNLLNKPEGVPDAPFKDTWHQLALKRALKYAADNGYDRVGLTTGRQQVDRYTNELRQNVDELQFFPIGNQNNILISAKKGGKQTFSGTVADGKFIDGPAEGKTVTEVLGKSMAKQIAEKKDGVIKGDDLTIGGEGMKAYYDEIYPAFLAKQGKKYNAKTGETRIKTGQGIPGGASIRYIDISPEMRGGVKKGQPLFTAAPIGGIGLGAGTQDNEMPDAVRQYMADPRYSDPFADTTR